MSKIRWFFDGGNPPAQPPADPASPSPFATLPEDLRGDPSISKFTKVEDLARSYISAMQMAGNRDPNAYIPKPGADDPDPAGTLLRTAGFVPKEFGDEYTLKEPEGVAESLKLSGPLGAAFRKTAFEAGLPAGKAEKIYHWFAGEIANVAKTQAEAAAKEEAAWTETLKGEFGDAFNARMAAFDYAVEQLGGAELKTVLEQTGLGKHPALVKALAKAGVTMSRGTDNPFPAKDGGGFGVVMTPQEYKAEGDRLIAESISETNLTKSRLLADKAQKFYDLASKAGNK